MPGGHLMRRRRYIFVSRGLVPRSGSYPRSRRHHHLLPGGHLCIHQRYARSAQSSPPGNVDDGAWGGPAVGGAPRHQPQVNARRTRSARTAIPLRGMVAKAVELSAVPSAIRPRSAAFNRMVRSGLVILFFVGATAAYLLLCSC